MCLAGLWPPTGLPDHPDIEIHLHMFPRAHQIPHWVSTSLNRRVDTGTSPTVLSILQQRGAEELLTPLKQHSEAYRQKGDTMDQISGGMSGFSIADGNAPRPGFPNAFAKQTDVGAQLPHTGGLAAMLSAPRSAVASSLPTQSMFMAQASSSFGASSSMGFKKGVVLATSFRDPSNLPPPLPEDLLTEAAGETSSDDEELGAAAARRRRAAAGGRGKSGLANSTAMDEDDDDDDDDDSPKISGRGHTSGLGRGNGRKMMDSRDEGVFGGDFS